MSTQNKTILHPTTRAEVESIIGNHPLVFIKWSTAWCGPCKQIKPYYETLCAEYGTADILFVSLRADGNEALASLAGELGVTSVPTFQVYLDQKLVKQYVGASKTDLKALIDEYVE